jgi:hypothetical protein
MKGNGGVDSVTCLDYNVPTPGQIVALITSYVESRLLGRSQFDDT